MVTGIEEPDIGGLSVIGSNRVYDSLNTKPVVGTPIERMGEPKSVRVDDPGSVATQSTSVVDEQLIETLTETSDRIVAVLKDDLPQSFQERVDAWCEMHGFDSIEESQERSELVARQASFHLLLKTTLYEWHYERDDLPPLSNNIRKGLKKAKNRVENPAFGEYVLDEIVWLVDEKDVEAIVDERHRLLRSTQPAEDIGQIYASLTPGENRRTLSQYRTRPDIATLMRTWAACGGDTVLDPGMGAGVLSTPFHPRWEVSTDPDHVIGIDRSPLAALMGTTALRLSQQSHDSKVGDFVDLGPEDLSGDVDAIICNPPFTSSQDLSSEYKDALNTQIEEETRLDVSKHSALYAYFIYHSRMFLNPGDRAAVITSQSYLSANYGETLKQFLLSEFNLRALVQFNPESESVFADANVTALIAFLEATNESKATGCTRFIRVDELPEMNTLREAVDTGQQGDTDWGFINCIPQESLSPEQNWEILFDPVDVDTSHLTPLGEFVSVHRGESTGNVSFYCLSQNDVDEIDIDEKHLSRLVRRPKLVDGFDFCEEDWEQARANGKDVWLLDPDRLPGVPDSVNEFNELTGNGSLLPVDTTGNDEHDLSHVLAYLQRALTEHELQNTWTVKENAVWYRPKRKDSARVLVDYNGRGDFTFILNKTDTRNINNFYGFYDMELNETELKALLAYLNSGFVNEVIREYRRTRQGGFETIGVSDLEDVPAVNPKKLSTDIVTTLATAFDELRETARNDTECDSVIEDIDTILRREL